MASKVQAPPSEADRFKNERTALSQVLQSGCLDRAPALTAILTYVCNAYFEERTQEIKEYTVATEALGRKPEFDQRKDSIVRVEMYRLRKRLRQFYAEAGAELPLQIDVAEGGYTPIFKEKVIADFEVVKPRYYGKTTVVRRTKTVRTVRPPDPESSEKSGAAIKTENVTPPEKGEMPDLTVLAQGVPAAPWPSILPTDRVRARSTWKWVLAGVTCLAILVGIGLALRTPSTEKKAALATSPLRRTVRILAGRETSRYLDLTGRVWEGDQFFHGGKAIATRSEATVFGSDPNLFSSRRQGRFSYAIPLLPGFYQARLWFADTDDRSNSDPSQLVTVRANGATAITGLNVTKDAGGPNITDIRVLTGLQPGSDGFLRLSFDGPAFLNALEVFPTDGPKMAPLRIIPQLKGQRTTDGNYWEADQFYSGGESVVRALPVLWSKDPQLLRGERYGNFQYTLPVAPGLYTISLYFAETWFPQVADRPTHLGNRVFSVKCNQTSLLENFDLSSAAHRSYAGVRLSFPHLMAPDTTGKLVLRFESVKNFANVNGIEVLPE